MNTLDTVGLLEVGAYEHLVQPEEGVLVTVDDDPGHVVGLLGRLGTLEIWLQFFHYNNPKHPSPPLKLLRCHR